MHTDPPVISNLEHKISEDRYYSEHSLICTTTGSPPTSVTWMRNDTELINCSVFQRLTDRHNSTYENTIILSLSDENLVGEYSCSAENIIGKSNVTTIFIEGISYHRTSV